MPDFPFPYVTVGGFVVAKDGKLLLVKSHKWKNLYTVPGGKVELGETLDEAFRREIKEETNLELDQVQFAIVQDCIYSEEFMTKQHFVMHDYIGHLSPSCNKENVVLNDESQQFVWVTPQQAREYPLTEGVKVLLDWYERNYRI